MQMNGEEYGSFDVIVSNPPYLWKKYVARMNDGIRHGIRETLHLEIC